MIGKQVNHKAFGVGSITRCENGKLTIDFSGSTRVFRFPESFERFLSTDDTVLQGMVADAFKEKAEAEQKAEEARRIAKVEEEAAALRAAQAVSHIPFPDHSKEFPVERQAQGANESVAFKCNFCDGGASGTCIGFRGKCSDWMIRYNIEKAKRVWCSLGSVCRQYYNGYIDRAELDAYRSSEGIDEACYESGFFTKWTMGAGFHHTGPDAGKPMHLNRVHSGGLAVMTTRKPDDKEQDRFIFAVFLISHTYDGDDQNEGFVKSDPVWRMELLPGQAEQILFWNYYFNAKAPEKIVFGSGLHRYLTDIEAAQILRDIAHIRGDDFSMAFFMHFCEMNGIEAQKLGSPSGALIRRSIIKDHRLDS